MLELFASLCLLVNKSNAIGIMCKIFQTITEPVTSINLNHMFVHGVNQIIDWHKFRIYLVSVFAFVSGRHIVRIMITAFHSIWCVRSSHAHKQMNYDLYKAISNGANTRRKQNEGKNAFHIYSKKGEKKETIA